LATALRATLGTAGLTGVAAVHPPFRYFLAVMLYIRFPLSLSNVEDLLHERGIEINH